MFVHKIWVSGAGFRGWKIRLVVQNTQYVNAYLHGLQMYAQQYYLTYIEQPGVCIGMAVSAAVSLVACARHHPRGDLSSRNPSQKHRHLLHPNREPKSESTRGLHSLGSRQSLLHTNVCSWWSAADGGAEAPSPSPSWPPAP